MLTKPNADMLDKATIGEALAGTDDTKVMTPLKVAEVVNKSVYPVGSIYIHFPGQLPPGSLFGGSWESISAPYAGRFFRVEGGNAAPFDPLTETGGQQDGGAPNILGTTGMSTPSASFNVSGAFYRSNTPPQSEGWSTGGYVANLDFDASKSNALYGSATEIRPINFTIKLWKRVA